MTIYIKKNDRNHTILTSFSVSGSFARMADIVNQINAGFASSGTAMFATFDKDPQ